MLTLYIFNRLSLQNEEYAKFDMLIYFHSDNNKKNTAQIELR